MIPLIDRGTDVDDHGLLGGEDSSTAGYAGFRTQDLGRGVMSLHYISQDNFVWLNLNRVMTGNVW